MTNCEPLRWLFKCCHMSFPAPLKLRPYGAIQICLLLLLLLLLWHSSLSNDEHVSGLLCYTAMLHSHIVVVVVAVLVLLPLLLLYNYSPVSVHVWGTECKAVVHQCGVYHSSSLGTVQQIAQVTQVSPTATHAVTSTVLVQYKHLTGAKPTLHQHIAHTCLGEYICSINNVYG